MPLYVTLAFLQLASDQLEAALHAQLPHRASGTHNEFSTRSMNNRTCSAQYILVLERSQRRIDELYSYQVLVQKSTYYTRMK